MGRICHELKNDPLVLDSFSAERLIKCGCRFLIDSDSSTRVGALRMFRYAIVSNQSVKQAIDLHVQLFVVRSLEREQKLLAERVQALKVIRRIMQIDAMQMPASLVTSLVAVASHKDDNMRRLCLETIRELALCNLQIIAETNGVKVLIDAILEPTFQDLADSLLMTLVMLLNEPATRAYIEPFIDTQVLLAPFTDTDVPAGNDRRQKWMASRNAVVKLMRSWTGIMVLTSNPQGLSSLIQLLVQPVEEDVQIAVLSTICEIFLKKMPNDKNDTLMESSSLTSMDWMPLYSQHNLLNNYFVIVLLAMMHCGILEALITLGQGSNRCLAEPAINLLADILRMASRLLPDRHCATLLSLPQLVSASSLTTTQTTRNQFKNIMNRSEREKSIRSSEMLGELASAVRASLNAGNSSVSIVSYGGSGINGVQLASKLLQDTNRPQNLPHASRVVPSATGSNSRKGSITSNLTSRELMVQELKRSMDAQMDDTTFKAPFTDTDVPAGNDRRQKWMASRNAVVKLMRSWTGIMVLTSNPQGLSSLIQLLVQPVEEDVQIAVLSTICEIFLKKMPNDKNDTLMESSSLTSMDWMPLYSQHNLLNNYFVIVLLAMMHCGILEALITLGQGSNRCLAEPAINLLADILRMASRLLPDRHCATLLSLPQLVSASSLTTTQTTRNQFKNIMNRSEREKSIRSSEMLGELASAVRASLNAGNSSVSIVSYGGSGINGVQLASKLLQDTNRPQNLPHASRVVPSATGSNSRKGSITSNLNSRDGSGAQTEYGCTNG
ncbi:hypothetical protein ABG067_003369 [Albugo candida]